MTGDNDEVRPDEIEPIVKVELDNEMVESGDVSILNVLVNHDSPQSLVIMGTIQDSEVNILIDSGSTYNFVQLAFVEKLKLQVQPIHAFKVYIGSGDSLVCSNFCLKVEINS